MPIKALRVALVALEVLVAVTALAGGLGLLTGAIQFPADWVQAMPFSSQVLPGLVLAVVVGGSALVAAWLTTANHTWSWLASLAAGMFLTCFEIVEAALEPQLAWLQPLFFAIGVIIIVLAALLWRAERHAAQTTPNIESERQLTNSGAR